MGKLREYLKQQWEDIRGDAKWDLLKKIWSIRQDIHFLLTVGGAAVITIFYAAWSWVAALPGPLIFVLSLTVFTLVIFATNSTLSLLSRWKSKQLVVSSAVSETTLGDDEIIHPSPGGILWRWNQELGATGPFCPHHRQERLRLEGEHGHPKYRDFDRDSLSHGWFACSEDTSEKFDSFEAHAYYTYQLRAQATSRFRARYNLNKEKWSGTCKIEYVSSEILWKGLYGGALKLLNKSELPQGASLYLRTIVKITATPPCLVEEILIDVAGDQIREDDWVNERIDQRELCLHFRVPASISLGKQRAAFIIRALGPNGGEMEQRSESFDVIIAQSRSELEEFSGTS